MKLNKLFCVFMTIILAACSNISTHKNEFWDFSASRDKALTKLKFSKDGEHDDYTQGHLKIIFPENRIFILDHVGYHVYLDDKNFNDIDQLTVYLPEMSAVELERIFNNFVNEMNLDIGNRKVEVNINKSTTFCANFANINFCLRFKSGHDKSKYIGFFQIAMKPIGQKF